jgi:hypothetical protein
MTEDEDFEFAVNEAAVYFDDNRLVVAFGDGKAATMEIERDEERDVVKRVLSDANTWAAFLGSLSAALKEHM